VARRSYLPKISFLTPKTAAISPAQCCACDPAALFGGEDVAPGMGLSADFEVRFARGVARSWFMVCRKTPSN
jgi:hypothetical protein